MKSLPQSFRTILLGLAALPLLAASLRAEEAPTSPAPLFDSANDAYDAGECKAAIQDFTASFRTELHDKEERDIILFRTSYCFWYLGDFSSAERGFGTFLRKNPKNQEARYRRAESLLRLGQREAGIAEAEKIEEAPLHQEAALLLAHTFLDHNEPELALRALRRVAPADNYVATFRYWKGVALFQYGEWAEARLAFAEAYHEAPRKSWMRDAALEWGARIDRELRFLRGRVSLGYVYDSNLAQQSVLSLDNNNNPTAAAPNSASYISDRALWTSLNLSALLHYDRQFQLLASLDASSPFYFSNRGYNNQNLLASLAGQVKLSHTLSVGGSARYQDSRYNLLYYQDSVTLAPDATWTVSPAFTLKGDFGYTAAIRLRQGRTYLPRVNARWLLSSWSALLFGASYTRAHGQAAFYTTALFPSQVAGVAFSSYAIKNISFGFNLVLPWHLVATPQAYRVWTDYDREVLPAGSDYATMPDRSDRAWIYSLELARVLVPNHWSVAASASYTKSRSTGLQGIPSGGLVSNFSYDRLYSLMSTTFEF